jgi:hypothetical protein
MRSEARQRVPRRFRQGRLKEAAGVCGGRGHLWVFNCNPKILDVLLCPSAIPMFLQECIMDHNRTPPPREKQVPKCTAEA